MIVTPALATPRVPALAAVAPLLAYPDERFPERVEACRSALAAASAAWRADLETFAGAVQGLSPGEREELFTRTFDLAPLCCLEVGWHLFGEQYERGAFLVRMRGLLREYGVPEGTELADHLASVLALLAVLPPASADELVAQTRPAVEKMLKGFTAKREPGESNPYQAVLTLVSRMLAERDDPAARVEVAYAH